MKKIISVLLVVVISFSTFVLTGCSDKGTEDMEAYLYTQYDQIYEQLTTAKELEDIQQYLISWANSNDIKVSHDKYNNVIMSKKATEGYENSESNIFQCTITLDNPENHAISMAVATYLLTKLENHGFIRVLFTADTDGTNIGAEKIKKAYIKGDNLISLDYYVGNSIVIGSAGSMHYNLSHTFSWTEPSYTHAFEISIKGLQGGSYGDTTRPNPITTIGDILASAKSSSILLEIAGFNGGESADTYPSNATAIILVNQNDIEKITKRVTSSQEKFEKKYRETEPDYTYTFTEIALPNKVIAYEDCSNLISFLYTSIDGVYMKDDSGEVIAKSNIGYIRTTSGNLEIQVSARSKNLELLNEMSTVFDTICGLCSIGYTSGEFYPIWENNMLTYTENKPYNEGSTIAKDVSVEENPLITNLTSHLSNYYKKDTKIVRNLEYMACAKIAMRNPNLNVIAFGLTYEKIARQTTVLSDFLTSNK